MDNNFFDMNDDDFSFDTLDETENSDVETESTGDTSEQFDFSDLQSNDLNSTDDSQEVDSSFFDETNDNSDFDFTESNSDEQANFFDDIQPSNNNIAPEAPESSDLGFFDENGQNTTFDENPDFDQNMASGDDFDFNDQNSNILNDLNDVNGWTSNASISDESVLDDTIKDSLSSVSDKDSFESLFVDNTPVAQSGANTSVLEAGACNALDAFELKYLDVPSIIVWGPRIRKSTDVTALMTSIKNDGLLLPLVVAPTKTEGYYVLIKGARRLIACAKLKMNRIPCIVNKHISSADIHMVEPLYSQCKSYSISDMLGYIKYLEKEKNITNPSMIEYLLNLNGGDYLKLMDVMDDNDDDIVSALLTGQLDIAGAYKKLEQKRKKMGKDALADARTAKIYSNAEKYGVDALSDSGETSMGVGLSDDEVDQMMSEADTLEDMSDVDGEALKQQGDSIEGYAPHKQDPNNRERLDPHLRKAVLARDNNHCRICGLGGQEYSEVLDVHHIVEVYLGGKDEEKNLITACTCCHKLVHLWGRGELQVRPFEEMDEAEAAKFKRIIKLGNIIREGMAAKGMKREQLKKLDQADTIGRRMKGSSDQVAG